MKQSFNFLRASRSIAKTGLFLGSNGGLKIRSKIVLNMWFQRVPKWTPKVDKIDRNGVLEGSQKGTSKRDPLQDQEKLDFAAIYYTLAKSEVSKKSNFLGTILGSILETKS